MLFNRITVEKVSNIAKLHTYYITNAQNEFNYFNHTIPESEFEQIMENYANMVEFDDDMFDDNIEESEEADADYISDSEDLVDLLQCSNTDLEIEEMLDFKIFLEEKTNETTSNNIELDDNELDYDIEEIINASMSKNV